jgi:hypothetical protein
MFVEQVNSRHKFDAIPVQTFAVSQERNTTEAGEAKDISDIVLEGNETVVVIENYYRSDGHYHSYQGYLNFAKRLGDGTREAVVVLLCQYLDDDALAEDRNDGWRDTPIVTYADLLSALAAELSHNEDYKVHNAECYWFIGQLVSFFVKGTPVNEDLVAFIAGMCTVGEAERYRNGSIAAADQFAQVFSELAKQQLTESRALLQNVKLTLREYAARALLPQLARESSTPHFSVVSARYQGIYQWTVNFLPSQDTAPLEGEADDSSSGVMRLKFGPSAWFANETDEGHKYFKKNVPADAADYSRLFFTWRDEIRQSAVSMLDVLNGLSDDDTRLRDEVLALVRPGR